MFKEIMVKICLCFLRSLNLKSQEAQWTELKENYDKAHHNQTCENLKQKNTCKQLNVIFRGINEKISDWKWGGGRETMEPRGSGTF